MKEVDGVIYYRIGEVASKLGKTAETIRNWYGWYIEQDEKIRHQYNLPEIYYLDKRQTRYFKAEDISRLEDFSRRVTYGMLASYNHKLWGSKGIKSTRRNLV